MALNSMKELKENNSSCENITINILWQHIFPNNRSAIILGRIVFWAQN